MSFYVLRENDMDLDAKNLILLHARNKSADQHAHQRRLVSAFIKCSQESRIAELSTDQKSSLL